MKRILAHTIIYEGQSYPMHLAEYDTHSGKVTLTPFNGETPDTVFFSGTVEVRLSSDGLVAFRLGESTVSNTILRNV